MKNLRLSEIYQTFQGEGPHTGEFTSFVRFSSCNLRCSGWGVKTILPNGKEVLGCDTPHAVFPELYKDDPKLTAKEIIEKIPLYPRHVTLTGGEPFMQPHLEFNALVWGLLEKGYTIDVFTNGTLDWTLSSKWIGDPLVTLIVDYKLPGSGEFGLFLYPNLGYLSKKDEIKFVIKDGKDYQLAKETIHLIEKNFPRLRYSMGPVWKEIDPILLIEWILRDKLDVRLNLQTHQLLGVDQKERDWHVTA